MLKGCSCTERAALPLLPRCFWRPDLAGARLVFLCCSLTVGAEPGQQTWWGSALKGRLDHRIDGINRTCIVLPAPCTDALCQFLITHSRWIEAKRKDRQAPATD